MPHINEDPEFGAAMPGGQDPVRSGDNKSLEEDITPGDLSDQSKIGKDAVVATDADAALDNLLKETGDDNDPSKPDAGGAGDTGDGGVKDDGDGARADDGGAVKADDNAAGNDNKPDGIEPDDKGAAKADDKAAAKDQLDSVELPPYAKPSTAASFEKVKTLARQEISQRDTQISELTEKVSKLEGEVKNRLSPEETKELEELRQWRKSFDVESDPSFKSFDARVSSNDEAIYAHMKKQGLPDEKIEEMKALGGPAYVNWEHFFKVLPASSRRYIEAKLVDSELAGEQKREAVEKAKADADGFLKQRDEKAKAAAEKGRSEVRSAVDSYVEKLEWTKEQRVPANATPEQKKSIEARNDFAKNIRKQIDDWVKDESPASRAEMVVGTAMAYYYKAAYEARDKAVSAAKKEAEELRAELDKVKKAGGAGRRSNAPTTSAPKAKVDLLTPASDALDALRAQIAAD